MLLAGDVGGTKTNLGIFTPDNGWRHPIAEVTFKSTNFSTLEAMLREFLDSEKVVVRHVSLGVAGPVDNGKARITNLNWTLEDRKLRKALDLDSVRLINDLEAIAYRVPSLGKSDLKTLNKGKSVPEGSKAIVAPGTGLGEAFLTWDEDRYSVHASEGGHSDFAPSSPLEIDLLRYLQGRFGHASFERACSGPGMRNIHEFLEEKGIQGDKAWHDLEKSLDDPVPLIVETALHDKGRCRLCDETLKIFVSILAHEASNLALKVKATNGVYLGGGIPTRILPALAAGLFMKSFGQKGKLAYYVKKFPVYVIRNPKVAMEGAARFGISQLKMGS